MGQELPQIYTVSSLTREIRERLETGFPLVWVSGEVSNLRVPVSGHCYFTLKDPGAQLRAVLFRGNHQHLRYKPEEGRQVLCRGRLTVYEARGEYQLIVDYLEPLGLGALAQAFEALKTRLAAEGLFDQARKRPLPFLPRRLALVTSPTGAVVRDFLRLQRRRFPGVEVLIRPVKVQGAEAAGEIVQALTELPGCPGIEVIILARGGGSLEDLWPFNEEAVARAIYHCPVPVVSAVGHEVDITIADLVADVRAPTPTAAADMVVRDKKELRADLRSFEERLRAGLKAIIERARLSLYRHIVDLKERRDFIVRYRMYLDELLSTLTHGLASVLRKKRTAYEALLQRLEDLNPTAIMKRGYSITMRAADGKVVTDAGQTARGDGLVIRLYEGELKASVDDVRGEPLPDLS